MTVDTHTHICIFCCMIRTRENFGVRTRSCDGPLSSHCRTDTRSLLYCVRLNFSLSQDFLYFMSYATPFL
uniref:Uncharacterized protein n=1 Tax=Trichogramma kaykai TaxID=54128 RepID=A0ABD2WY74_9HYME